MRELVIIVLLGTTAAMGCADSRGPTGPNGVGRHEPGTPWYIKVDGTGHAPTIQAGMDSAAYGDTVLVASGTYTWTNQNADGDFMIRVKPGVCLRSESGAAMTILDVEGNDKGIRFQDGDENTQMIGFSVTDSRRWTIYCHQSSPVISGNVIVDNGGLGIYCHNYSSPEVVDNQILRCDGPGILCRGTCDPDIIGNTIIKNEGTGIACTYSSSPTISDNLIALNKANWGAGVHCIYSSSPQIVDNRILDNEANSRGGGISSEDGSCYPVITGNLIIGNSARNGAGIYCHSLMRITHNVIADNSADIGGGIMCDNWSPDISNNTMVGNSAERGPAIHFTNYSGTLAYNIIADHGEDPPFYCAFDHDLTGICNAFWKNPALCDCTYGDWDWFSADPLFCDEEARDCRLQQGSPCSPDHSPCGELVGALLVGCD